MVKMLLSFCFVGCLVSLGNAMYYDLSYPYENNTIVWNPSHKFKFNRYEMNDTQNKVWYFVETIEGPTHGGTHLDAPCHFVKGKWCVTDIPLARLLDVPAVVVDISKRAAKDPDAQLEVKDLEDWQAKHGLMPKGCVVFLRAGWGKRWPDRAKFFGSDSGDSSKYHFPGFSPEAAKWIRDRIVAVGIGTDSPSVDSGQNKMKDVHNTLGAVNLYNLENVANLEVLPERGYLLDILPMKIQGGSGAPVRIVAKPRLGSGAAQNSKQSPVVVLGMTLFAVVWCFLSAK